MFVFQNNDVGVVRRVVADSTSKTASFYKELGFKVAEEGAKEVRGSKTKAAVLVAALGTINPDPQKRFS